MRPTSRSPSRCDSTSIGTTSVVAVPRATVNSRSRPGFGCTRATSAWKSPTGSPSTATISSPSRSPARSAGLPGSDLADPAGTIGYQKSNPSPGQQRAGLGERAPLAVDAASATLRARAIAPRRSQLDGAAVHQFVEDRQHGRLARRASRSPPTPTISSPAAQSGRGRDRVRPSRRRPRASAPARRRRTAPSRRRPRTGNWRTGPRAARGCAPRRACGCRPARRCAGSTGPSRSSSSFT